MELEPPREKWSEVRLLLLPTYDFVCSPARLHWQGTGGTLRSHCLLDEKFYLVLWLALEARKKRNKQHYPARERDRFLPTPKTFITEITVPPEHQLRGIPC